MLYSIEYGSPLGTLTLASDGEALLGLWLSGQKNFGGTLPLADAVPGEVAPLRLAKSWLDGYFAGEAPVISQLPLAPAGSPFRQAVWQLLCEIPYGKVCTYGDLARALERRLGSASVSARAVGGAVGHNPISLIIPCHRVIGAGGSLTGYAGGLECKQWLLAWEGSAEHLASPAYRHRFQP